MYHKIKTDVNSTEEPKHQRLTITDESDLIIASELTLVLLGMSVLEKTAVEHVIFGREESQCDASPALLMKITVDTGVVDGEKVTVINTPDWFSSALNPDEIKQKIQFCIGLSSHGPYALLLVIPVNQFLQKEKEIVYKFENFQNTFCKRLMILFTATNEQEELEIQKHDLKPLKDICVNRFHVLNISQVKKRDQVSELLKKVEIIVKGNVQSSDVCKISETQREKAIAISKQVSVEETNYIKVSSQKLQCTVWTEPNEPFEIIDYP
ncbi:GTPase IMAP family member 8-like [Cyprinus carpio]|nr:GTPase IMAP family member 8-like [Cyprinus carpio]